MAAPDPLTSQDTRNALARRAPNLYDRFNNFVGSLIDRNKPPGMSQAAATEFGPQTIAANTVDGPGRQYDDVKPAVPAAPAAPVASGVPVHVVTPDTLDAPGNDPTIRPALGMRRLAPGVMRSSVPGVYVARGKDGSVMFSNVTGNDGQPDFGTLTPQEQAIASSMSRRFAGTQADPRSEHYNPDTGMTSGPGITTPFTRDTLAGQVDPNGLHGLSIGVSGPNAGFTFAGPSGNIDVPGQIDAATNPYEIQAAQRELADAIDTDPNASNPEVAAANRQAMRRLSGAFYDKVRQFYGNPEMQAAATMGGMGGLGVPALFGGGTGTGRGVGNPAVTYKDIVQAQAERQNAETNAAKAATDAAQGQAQIEEAQRNNIANSLTKDPERRAALDALGVDPTTYSQHAQLALQLEKDDPELRSPAAQSLKTFLAQKLTDGIDDARGYAHGIIDSETKLSPPSGALVRGADGQLHYDNSLKGFSLEQGALGRTVLRGPNGAEATLKGIGAGGLIGHMLAAMGLDNYSPALTALLHDPVYGPLLQRFIAQDNAGMARRQ